LVELLLCLISSFISSVAVVRETIDLSLADPPGNIYSWLPPPEHHIPLTLKINNRGKYITRRKLQAQQDHPSKRTIS
jgi:hypothetical protein